MTKPIKKPTKTLSALALKLTRSSWKNIKQRCKRDGTFLDQQFATFEGFLAYIGPRTSAKYTCDRIDYDKGYERGNVRWASKQQQSLNRRNAVKLTHGGETLPIIAWAARLKVPAATLRRRKRLGWTDSEIVSGSRAGARKPSANSPWPGDRAQDWERSYAANGKRVECREVFYRRICRERQARLMKRLSAYAERCTQDGETQPSDRPAVAALLAELELVKRLLADAELKCAAAARRLADPYGELFRS